MYILYSVLFLIWFSIYIKLIDYTDDESIVVHMITIISYPILTIGILLQVFYK